MINFFDRLDECRIGMLKEALGKYPKSYAMASRYLQISRSTFTMMVKRYGLYKKANDRYNYMELRRPLKYGDLEVE